MVEEANPNPSPEQNNRPEHASVQFEHADVYHRPVLYVMGAAALIVAVVFAVVWWFFGAYNRYESAIKQSPFPLAPGPSTQLPVEPRLEQVDRLAEVQTPNVYLREESKEKRLNNTGPTTEKGFVHIPIERAMKCVVKDLPVRKETRSRPARDNGLVDDGEPNSGRLFREGGR